MLAFCFFSYSKAQDTVATPNLVTQSWSGALIGNYAPGGISGGSSAAYNPETNTILFGYTQRSVTQNLIISELLRQQAGINVRGYQYQWEVYNSGSNRGTLSAGIAVFRSDGSLVNTQTFDLNADTNGQWVTTQGTKNFDNPYALNQQGVMQLSFTGKDNRFWAGYYGPLVRNADVRLLYQPDPCTLNPALSPDCPGFKDIITSNNIGATSYAINTALNIAGAGVMIHGLNYGYRANFGDQVCNNFNLFGLCFGEWVRPSYNLTVNVTDSDNKNIYQNTHSDAGNNLSYNYNFSHTFPQSRNLRTLGNYQLVYNTNGAVTITDTWSNWRYTPDPCVVNPLSSVTCEGYNEAYFVQQCSVNPFYNQTCPGYAEALRIQQCSANALYDPSCPGYEKAFFDQQCMLNALYNIGCPGYQKAYFDQQCAINPLYNTECPGYAQANFTKQCTDNPLFNTECSGYKKAFFDQQCSLNPLYNSECPLYQQAYFNQQCSLNPLYNSGCAGYAAAYFNSQCLANPLYNTQCPGYQKALFDQQCQLNPLSSTGCPLYQQAYLAQQCNLNQLFSTNCPNYQQAYFDQQCKLNTLYNPGCPGYAEAYRAKLLAESCQANPQSSPQCPNYRNVTASTSTNVASNSAAAEDPVKSVSDTPLVSDPVVNQAINTTTNTPGSSPGSTPGQPLGTGLQVPGFNQFSSSAGSTSSTRSSRSTTTSSRADSARDQARRDAQQTGRQAERRVQDAQQQQQENLIAAMGTVPGFDAYQNSRLPDVPFYATREIYRNVTLPDNRRAQRQLSERSDRLHQEMINEQYRR